MLSCLSFPQAFGVPCLNPQLKFRLLSIPQATLPEYQPVQPSALAHKPPKRWMERQREKGEMRVVEVESILAIGPIRRVSYFSQAC